MLASQTTGPRSAQVHRPCEAGTPASTAPGSRGIPASVLGGDALQSLPGPGFPQLPQTPGGGARARAAQGAQGVPRQPRVPPGSATRGRGRGPSAIHSPTPSPARCLSALRPRLRSGRLPSPPLPPGSRPGRGRPATSPPPTRALPGAPPGCASRKLPARAAPSPPRPRPRGTLGGARLARPRCHSPAASPPSFPTAGRPAVLF